MKKIIALLLCVFSLHASIDEQMLEAERFFEAGAPEGSVLIYQELLEEPLEAWQQDILRVNLITSEVSQKRWSRGFQLLADLPQKGASPLILSQAEVNRATLYMNLPEPAFLSAKNALEDAKKWHCTVEKWQGYPECVIDLEKLLNKIGNRRIFFRKTFHDQALTALIEVNLISQLYDGLSKLQSQFPHIEDLTQLVKVYQPLNAIWDVFVKIPTDNPLPFPQIVKALQKNDRTSLEQLLNETLHTLDAKLNTFSVDELWQAKVQRVEQQVRLLMIDENASLGGLKAPLESLGELKTARELYAQAGQAAPETRNFYLKAIEQRLMYDREKNLHAVPQIVLHRALLKQKAAKALTQQLSILKQANSELSVVNATQQSTVKTAEKFPNTVIAWQQEEFQKKDGDAICLKHPWQRTIPHFDQGWESANLAEKALAAGRISEALKYQEQTIQAWERALSESEQTPPSESPEELDSPTQTLQQLVEMDLQDRELFPRETKPTPTERPW